MATPESINSTALDSELDDLQQLLLEGENRLKEQREAENPTRLIPPAPGSIIPIER